MRAPMRCSMLILALLSLPSVAVAVPSPLFQSMEESDVVSLLTPEEQAVEDQWALVSVRRNYVSLDPSPLYAPSLDRTIEVELNLFSDTSFTSTLTIQNDIRRRAWIGPLDGVAGSRAAFFLSRLPKPGRTKPAYAAAVREPEASYLLRKVGSGPGTGGIYAVEEVDFAALPLDDDLGGPAPKASIAPPAADTRAASHGFGTKSIETIDVLYLYTEHAALSVGDIESFVFMLEADSNWTLANSEADAKIYVVHLQQIDLPLIGNAIADRELLANDPQVNTLRDGFAADLVQLLVDPGWNPSICGVAYLNGTLSPFEAYSISRVDCSGQFTPTHELAHCMGCNHAPEDPTGVGAFEFCFGYKDPNDPNTPFRTVMAYDCPGGGCQRIPHFSSSTVEYFGRPTGNADQDNARCLSLSAPYVAGFRIFTVEYLLTVTLDGQGGVESLDPPGIDCPGDCSELYGAGTQVELLATPDPGWVFSAWSGNGGCSGNDVLLTILLDEDVACEATFVPDGTDPTLTVSKAGDGTGTVTSQPAGIDCDAGCQQDSASFAEGTSVTLTADDDAGSEFNGWGGGCSGGAAVITFTIDQNMSCTATFEDVGGDPTLTVIKEGAGTGTVTSNPSGIDCDPSCQQDTATFPPGTSVQISAAASAGSVFTSWGGDCSGNGSVVMNGNKTCTVRFEIVSQTHTLNVIVAEITGAEGYVDSVPAGIACEPDCEEDYGEGAQVTLEASANAGDFIRWVGDGNCDGTLPVVTLTMDQPKSCTAIFRCTPIPECLGLP